MDEVIIRDFDYSLHTHGKVESTEQYLPGLYLTALGEKMYIFSLLPAISERDKMKNTIYCPFSDVCWRCRNLQCETVQ